MKLLDSKVAIITGASAGIGRATALLFSAQGASLVLNARCEGPLRALVDEIRQRGGNALAVCGDVSEAQTHSTLVHAALTTYGRLDVAVNNAGITGAGQPLADTPLEVWEQILATNLTAAYMGARSQIPAMLATGGGSIIFTSSFVGTSVGLPGMAAYGAAKAGLSGLAKGITADYAAKGVRANVLIVGGTDTAMAGGEAQKAWAAGLHALKRIAQPEEIAQAALFLASSMSSFVTGSALFAEGGNAAVKGC